MRAANVKDMVLTFHSEGSMMPRRLFWISEATCIMYRGGVYCTHHTL